MGGIDYKDLQWAATGERLNADTFVDYRKRAESVIIHVIPEEVATGSSGSASDGVGGDGLIENGKDITFLRRRAPPPCWDGTFASSRRFP